jgi:transposase-like protein
MVVADDHAGLREALKARPTGMPRQRCQFHLVKNALAFVSEPSMRKEVVASLRAVFDAPDRAEAERRLDIPMKKHRAKAPNEARRVAGAERAGGAGPCHAT